MVGRRSDPIAMGGAGVPVPCAVMVPHGAPIATSGFVEIDDASAYLTTHMLPNYHVFLLPRSHPEHVVR